MRWMRGYRRLLEKEVVEAWRTYRLGVVCLLFVALGIASPVIARYLPELSRGLGEVDAEIGLPETGIADVLDLLIRNLVLFGGVSAVLLAMGSVANEMERGTAALVLARPVGRAAFLWAKLVGLAMVLGLATGLAVLAAWLYTSLLVEPTPALPWIQMALVVWLSTMVAGSITVAGSTLASSSLGAGAIGVSAIAALTLASTVPTLNPWLPTGLFDVAMAAALGEVSPDLDPARTLLVSLLIIAGSFALAWSRFRRAEP